MMIDAAMIIFFDIIPPRLPFVFWQRQSGTLTNSGRCTLTLPRYLALSTSAWGLYSLFGEESGILFFSYVRTLLKRTKLKQADADVYYTRWFYNTSLSMRFNEAQISEIEDDL